MSIKIPPQMMIRQNDGVAARMIGAFQYFTTYAMRMMHSAIQIVLIATIACSFDSA